MPRLLARAGDGFRALAPGTRLAVSRGLMLAPFWFTFFVVVVYVLPGTDLGSGIPLGFPGFLAVVFGLVFLSALAVGATFPADAIRGRLYRPIPELWLVGVAAVHAAIALYVLILGGLDAVEAALTGAAFHPASALVTGAALLFYTAVMALLLSPLYCGVTAAGVALGARHLHGALPRPSPGRLAVGGVGAGVAAVALAVLATGGVHVALGVDAAVLTGGYLAVLLLLAAGALWSTAVAAEARDAW